MKIKRIDTKNKYGQSYRFYSLPDGTRVPSVTQILSIIGKPALIAWAAKTERKLVEEVAADVHIQFPNSNAVEFVLQLEEQLGKKKAFKREIEKASDIGTQA